ncbi:hypothetical protein GKA74_00210 [Vibrio parahaemolyticus]|nr:hypothetical protein [Vibrio parahaemolyticus]EGQ8700072.1 hypothetical protein [Vibrio parahaemolyticus]EGQ8751043.1 hypothetical protein [Vibrio parahaemolyticus]EGQ8758997.1 hypothetical protein [Vibrio parahaemolyticus]EGQ8769441.1 hypothetical protein [Vibrio parahaemolyticus]
MTTSIEVSLATMAWRSTISRSVVRLTRICQSLGMSGLVAGMSGVTNLVFVFHLA